MYIYKYNTILVGNISKSWSWFLADSVFNLRPGYLFMNSVIILSYKIRIHRYSLFKVQEAILQKLMMNYHKFFVFIIINTNSLLIQIETIRVSNVLFVQIFFPIKCLN